MPLIQTSWTLSGKTGSVVNIAIWTDHTTIEGVSYGVDASGAPKVVPVDSSAKTFSFTVLPNLNALIVHLVSPGPNDDRVIVQEVTSAGPNQLDDFNMSELSETWKPTIQGT